MAAMLLSKVAILFALANPIIATPSLSSHVLHERRDESLAWEKFERLPNTTLLPMRIGLTQSNLDRGHELLMEVSLHDSPKYGQYFTAEEVADVFAPSQMSVDTVRSWLVSAGIAGKRITQSVNKQWIQFDARAWEAEKLLRTEYHVSVHVASGKTSIGCDGYHVPETVQEHIDYIRPGIMLSPNSGLPAPKEMKRKIQRSLRRRAGGKSHYKLPPIEAPPPTTATSFKSSMATDPLIFCDIDMTPACIQALYNVTKGTKAAPGNQLGIFEDLGDVFSQDDLDLFFENLAPYIPTGTHPIADLIDGAVAPTYVADAGQESDLDLQISYPLIWPQNSIIYQTDDPVYEHNYTFEGFLNNFFDALDGSYCTLSAFGETGNDPIDPPYPDPAPGGFKGQLQCGVFKPTNVISISYGGPESDSPIYYQRRQCLEMMKLGMRGISLVVSSGDSGVAGPPGDPSASGCLGDDQSIFTPDFPANCPYITVLGGTFLPQGANVSQDQEVAVSRFPSGGGFSNIYATPDYQASAVEGYFEINLVNYPFYESVDNSSFGANGGIYNRAGRGYPDFAALGDNVVLFVAGVARRFGGTSASAPVFASLLTRINEERIAVGKKTIGFVNPTLYAHPGVFHDITVGSNPGCGTQGFVAGPGWDPVTGLGTPNYPAMLELFMSLP